MQMPRVSREFIPRQAARRNLSLRLAQLLEELGLYQATLLLVVRFGVPESIGACHLACVERNESRRDIALFQIQEARVAF
jgi:hypothetical protein